MVEEVGPFKIWRESCEHHTTRYNVRYLDGSLAESFNDLKKAIKDANSRYAQVLKNKYDADKNNIHTDSREV